MNQAQHNL